MSTREVPPTMVCGVVEQHRQGVREVLIGRIPVEPYKDRWTFPGGPAERGEAPEETLRRALNSLLGMHADVRIGQPPFDHAWDGVILRWRYFFCEGQASDVRNSHYAEIRWVPAGTLSEYEFDPVAQQVVDWMLEDPPAKQ